MVASPRWRPEPARSRASIWRERFGWVAALSLLLHISFVTLLFLTPAPPRPPPDAFVPPAEVAVLFNGGSNRAPVAPNPSPETSVGPPNPEKALTAPPAGSTPAPPLATPAQPVPLPAPSTPSVSQAMPPPPAAAASPPAPAPPAAVSPPPQAPLAMLPTPPVPPAVMPSIVPPAAAPPAPPRPTPAPPRLALARPAPRPTAPAPRPREDAFPKPLNFAFGGSLFDSHGSTGRAPPHESLGPVAPGPATSRSAFNSDISGDIGPDYRSLLHAWLERHKYYPPQAAENGEDGTASVRVIIQKDGSVRLVELEQRSGSTWLDMGAQAIFRGQRLPPFPSDAMGNEQEVTVTIHYILIRG